MLTNQTPVNEKSGNSESKSKSEEEAERKENVNIEAVINTDNVQNETRISISVSSSSFTSFSSKDNLSQQLQFILPHFSHTHSHGSLSQFEQGQTHGGGSRKKGKCKYRSCH
jgi:hypothetical protein